MLGDKLHSLVDTLNSQGQKRILKILIRRQILKVNFQNTYTINVRFCLTQLQSTIAV